MAVVAGELVAVAAVQTRSIVRGRLVLLLLLMGLSARVSAGFWEDLWRTPQQKRLEQLAEGDYQALIDDAPSADWEAVGRYRQGDFTEAAQQFESLYNKGTALTQAGRYDEAIKAFDDYLQSNPAHQPALKNREVARQLKALQQQDQQQQDQQQQDQQQQDQQQQDQQQQDQQQQDQQQQDQQQQDQQQQDQQQQDQQQQDQQQQDQQQQDQQQQDQQQQDQQQQDQQQQDQQQQQEQQQQAQQEQDQQQEDQQTQLPVEPLSEDQQAQEQLLRRIPDEPGGMLRRKLLRKHQMENPGAGNSATPW